MRRLFPRQLKGESKSTVPETTMVGCRISKNGKMVKERAKGTFIVPVRIGNALPECGWCKPGQKTGDNAERGYFGENPDRGPRHGERFPMMFDEILPASGDFVVELRQCLRVVKRIREMTIFKVSERPELMADLIGEA